MRLEGPQSTQAIEKDRIPANVESFMLERNSGAYQAFRIAIPEGYQVPPQERPTGWARSKGKTFEIPEPGHIGGGFTQDGEALLEELEAAGMSGFNYILLIRDKEGIWRLETLEGMPTNLPSPLLEMVKTALAHQASVDPHFEKRSASVNFRVEDPESFRTSPVTHPHVDDPRKYMDMYFVSSAPTTQFYAGTLKPKMCDPGDTITSLPGGTWWNRRKVQEHIRWFSGMPWNMYHLTMDNAHSLPDLALVSPEATPKKRFLIRITFE